MKNNPINITTLSIAISIGCHPSDSSTFSVGYQNDALDHFRCSSDSKSRFVQESSIGDLSNQPKDSYYSEDSNYFDITVGGGLVVADFDQNGFPDIYLPALGTDLFYLNHGDRYFELANEWLPITAPTSSRSVGGSVADFDGDGDLDIFLLTAFGHNRLLENTGHGFRDITEEQGIILEPGDSTAAVWYDFDLDNDLDLFVAGHKEDPFNVDTEWPTATSNRLYENIGTTFVHVEHIVEDVEAFTYAAAWIQPASGVKPWLYNINDFGFEVLPNRVYSQNEGYFQEHNGSGLDTPMYGMGISQGDINSDGHPDFLVSDFERVHLLLSDEHNTWYESAFALGFGTDIETQRFSWGVNIFDFDNDGKLDAFANWGPISNHGTGISADDRLKQPNSFWMNDGHSFQSMTAVWEINESSISRGSIVVDLDKDGIQDLIVGNIDAPAEIWWGRCMNGDWISLQIEQNSMNRYGVGSKVTSITESGQHTQWIVAGDSFASGGPPTVHFGLGSISEEMTNIIIELPTGQRFEHQLEKNMHHIVHLDE